MRCLSILAVVLLALMADRTAGGAAQEATPAQDLDVPDPSECTVEPRPIEDFEALVKTPSATEEGSIEQAPDEASPTAFVLPQGKPADDPTVEGVTTTVRELLACSNAGDLLRTAALYTKAFLERTFADLTEEDLAASAAEPEPVKEEYRIGLISLSDVVVLDDGRVGAVVEVDDPLFGGRVRSYMIFEREGDLYLIDDVVLMGGGGGAGPRTPPPPRCILRPWTCRH